MSVIEIDRLDDFLEFLLVPFRATFEKHLPRFVDSTLLHQPTRAPRNGEEHQEKQQSRNSGNTQLPTPLNGSEIVKADQEIGEIGKQNSKHHIELEEAHQP